MYLKYNTLKQQHFYKMKLFYIIILVMFYYIFIPVKIF